MTGQAYTPTTEEIRDGYSWSTGGFYHEFTDEGFAEFDLWVAEVVRQAKAEAWDEGYRAHMDDDYFGRRERTPTPYGAAALGLTPGGSAQESNTEEREKNNG